MGAVVRFRAVGEDGARAARLRDFLAASAMFEKLHTLRRRAVNLLAAAGAVLWVLVAGAFRSVEMVRQVALIAWSGLLGFVVVVGTLELVWRRRRDLAASHLPR